MANLSEFEKDIAYRNMPDVSVGQAVEMLSDMYCSVIGDGKPGIGVVPSVMLWGPPGVGKSQGIRQIGDKIKEKTRKEVYVTDVRLLLFNPIDLRGIPVANEDKTRAVWLRPEIFNMKDSEDVINILFLDEISAAPKSVQAAAYQLTLDHKVGEHKLPANCIVIAAGNRVTDKSVATEMPKALANRFLHLQIHAESDSWIKWAVDKGIHEMVIGFLSFQSDMLMVFDPANNDLAFPTPRTWEKVSNLLNHVDDDVEKIQMLIEGLVGSDATAGLLNWSRVYKDLPNIEGIFNGTVTAVPEELRIDVSYALVSSMVRYASEHRDDLEGIENSIKYAQKLKPEFQVILVKGYMYIEEGYREKLMGVNEYQKMVQSLGSMLDGIE